MPKTAFGTPWSQSGISDALGKYQETRNTTAHDPQEVRRMKKLTVTKLEKRLAPRYVPF